MTTHHRDATDDGFHEIQLSGKQLVFLFMAATVASVVVFLCGVLVGRGVRTDRGAQLESLVSESVNDLTPATADAPPAEVAGGTAAEPPSAEDLSYFSRLEQPNLPPEDLKPAAKAPEPAPAEKPAPLAAAPPPSTPPAPAPAPQAPAQTREEAPKPPAAREQAPAAAVAAAPAPAPVPAEPRPGSGFAVQLAALNSRSDAEAMAKRLSSKGYSAFVLDPASGGPAVYRVRVGTFSTRKEADSIASKLKKEEQFNPWVTR